MPTFSSLPLSPAMCANLAALGYDTPTDIQLASIPAICAGQDVLAQAKTGSGKTAAFGIGLLEALDPQRRAVQALVLCPTRELAMQVAAELRRLARAQPNLKVLTLTGGAPLRRQTQALSHPAHVVVGTPGRLLKHLEQGALRLDALRTLVLDEADRMLDMGFIDQITAIVEHTPAGRQTLCFSATLPAGVQRLCTAVQRDAEHICVDVAHAEGVITHAVYRVAEDEKIGATVALLALHQPESTIIFCNTKAQCRAVQSGLSDAGVHCLAFHGDLEQHERTSVLVRFANRSCMVLVATDVAARGLDIEHLAAVVNYDLPFKPQTYVHRVGRTGRAGATGQAFSFVARGQGSRVQAISEALGIELEAEPAPECTSRVELWPPMVTLSINGGRRDKISAGHVVGALTAKGGVAGDAIGQIDRHDRVTFVAVARAHARSAYRVLRGAPIKKRRFRVTLYD